ncbi:hypothetical protein KVQ82_16590 [Pseudomonas sp. AO-1]|uniref:hypothetical protein n=1 Tax=Pseudomonas sp. AO-1 TaxID=2855434 RepID=UPI001C7575C8|nr:hypothetical protein [Pseudomonas sp. AO-1]QXZ11708.1 hypothetical protein KVQ82_16590 [Pseudomonas sp. AO-1]
MTNNPTIDGVSRELLERLLTEACNENWSDLNELLHAPAACRCRRFGKDNPHWPCPVHSAQAEQLQGDQHGPTAAMTEAGCQAYMDADGMIGIMHNSSMGHAYVAMRTLDPELAALQSTIARLQARVKELESVRGECMVSFEKWWQEESPSSSGDYEKSFAETGFQAAARITTPPAPVAVVPDGWKLVPIEPTDDMIVAFAEAWYSKRQTIDDPDMFDAYRDMLASSPACLDATAALNNKPSTEVNP